MGPLCQLIIHPCEAHMGTLARWGGGSKMATGQDQSTWQINCWASVVYKYWTNITAALKSQFILNLKSLTVGCKACHKNPHCNVGVRLARQTCVWHWRWKRLEAVCPNLTMESPSPAPCAIFTEAGFHQVLYFRPIDYLQRGGTVTKPQQESSICNKPCARSLPHTHTHTFTWLCRCFVGGRDVGICLTNKADKMTLLWDQVIKSAVPQQQTKMKKKHPVLF